MSSMPNSRPNDDAQQRSQRPEGAEDPAARVTELQARVAELEDLRRRALADLDNTRKRMARDLERERRAQRDEVSTRWLPVVDDLERALEHADADPVSLMEGVRGVYDRALATLRELGYSRRDDMGARFDPARHEAVAVRTHTGSPPGTVVEVHQPGYGDDEHQLRPALVSVAGKDQ